MTKDDNTDYLILDHLYRLRIISGKRCPAMYDKLLDDYSRGTPTKTRIETDVITEEDAYPFPTLPRFDCGMKVGCITDILINPTTRLYQRETSIYCPIFL